MVKIMILLKHSDDINAISVYTKSCVKSWLLLHINLMSALPRRLHRASDMMSDLWALLPGTEEVMCDVSRQML